MTLSEVITNIEEQNEEAVIYPKKVDGKIARSSEAVVLELDEEDEEV